MKKLLSLALAATMIASMATMASATSVNTSGGGGDVALTGTVAETATLVSVTLPTNIAFAIQTEDGDFKTLTSGTGTITNNLTSAPAYVQVEAVSESGGDLLGTDDLILSLAATNAAKTVALTGFTDKTDLLTLAANGSDTLKVTGSAPAETPVTAGDTTITVTLKVYATAQP